MTSRSQRAATMNLAVVAVIGVAAVGMAVVTVVVLRLVLSAPVALLPDFNLSGLQGAVFAADLRQDASAHGSSPRDPALIRRALDESGTTAQARVPGGGPAARATRREWAKAGWRVEIAIPPGFECVTVPATADAMPAVDQGPCRRNLGS